MENKSGIDFLLETLKGAQCKVILERNCFVVSFSDFYRIQEVAVNAGMHIQIDDKLERQLGFVNIQIRMSPKEKQVYYVVAEVEPFLDDIWAKNFKGDK